MTPSVLHEDGQFVNPYFLQVVMEHETTLGSYVLYVEYSIQIS